MARSSPNIEKLWKLLGRMAFGKQDGKDYTRAVVSFAAHVQIYKSGLTICTPPVTQNKGVRIGEFFGIPIFVDPDMPAGEWRIESKNGGTAITGNIYETSQPGG